jgi:hypothetical protein
MSAASKRTMPGTAMPKPPERAKVKDLSQYGMGGPTPPQTRDNALALTQRLRLARPTSVPPARHLRDAPAALPAMECALPIYYTLNLKHSTLNLKP